MNTLYVLICGWDYEGFHMLGVFTTPQKAVDAGNKRASEDCYFDYLQVHAFVADEPRKGDDIVWDLHDGWTNKANEVCNG